MPSTTEAAEPSATGSEAFPITRLDLVEEARRMRASPRPRGHLAKTVLHANHMRVVLMLLDRGTRIPRHHAKGSLAIQTLEGRVVLAVLGSSFDLGAGQLLAIEPGVSHAVVAIEDSAILLTIAR